MPTARQACLAHYGGIPPRCTSFLQGCGCQLLAVFQNTQQFRFAYGPHSPLLASVATSVYYCPSDPDTADYLSGELGVTTTRLHPETQHRSFWGVLSSTSLGTTEHERPLLTPDECRRLDESAAVIISKGLAPILGEKLGSPAPQVIDLGTPMRKVVAAGLAAIFLAGLAGWAWVLRTPTPAPALSQATVTPTTGVSIPFASPPGPETRRIPITVDYQHLPATMRLVHAPTSVTGEFLASDPEAFDQEVRLRVDMANARIGNNYVMLLPKEHLDVPPGLRMPTSAWTGVDPHLDPRMLTVQTDYTPEAPTPWVLQEVKSQRIVSRYHTSSECMQAQMTTFATAHAQHQPPPPLIQCVQQP